MTYRCRYDKQWTMEYVSENCKRLTGYNKKDLIGNRIISYNDLILPEYREDIWKVWAEAVLSHQPVYIEYVILTADNQEKWVWEQGVPVYNDSGEIEALEGLIIDITSRKQAEFQNDRTIKALEKQMEALFRPGENSEHITFQELFNLYDIQKLQDEFARATGVASLITTPDGIPITKESNFCRLCSEIIRKNDKGIQNCRRSDALIGRYHPEGPVIQKCLSGGLWDAGASISVGNFHIANWLIGEVRDETQSEDKMREYARVIGADEEEVAGAFKEVTTMPLEKFNQIAQFLFTLANQISDIAYQNWQQARLISELKKSEAQRDAAFTEREKLETQLRQAQKMESVGRLAGGVAHDFNNMLSVILGHTEMLLDRVDSDNPLFSSLKEIKMAGERSADLTRQLLAFARKQNIEPKIVNLNEIIDGTLNMLKRLIRENIELSWQPGENLLPIKVDISQVNQILANLCVNARDALGNTGTITIKTANIYLDSHFTAENPGFTEGDFVQMSVSDNGCGMSEESIEKLFEPFFTTKEQGKGIGLGLATVYGIVKQHNGYINVSSRPGEGSTFIIYFPKYESIDEPLQRKVPQQETVYGNETILLVEDEPAILEITKITLENLGYNVLSAASPREALSLAMRYDRKIHLLLTDVIMPEMNGRELSAQLLALYPDLKRIFMSGYTADIIAPHGVLEDGVNFIQKPFTPGDLSRKIRIVIDN